MMEPIVEIIMGILVLSVGFNLWFFKQMYNDHRNLRNEIQTTHEKAQGTQDNLYQFQTEVVRDFITKEEFNRYYNMISENIRKNNEDVIKKIEHMEKRLDNSINYIEEHMLTKEQFGSEKKNFQKRSNEE